MKNILTIHRAWRNDGGRDVTLSGPRYGTRAFPWRVGVVVRDGPRFVYKPLRHPNWPATLAQLESIPGCLRYDCFAATLKELRAFLTAAL